MKNLSFRHPFRVIKLLHKASTAISLQCARSSVLVAPHTTPLENDCIGAAGQNGHVVISVQNITDKQTNKKKTVRKNQLVHSKCDLNDENLEQKTLLFIIETHSSVLF